MKTFLLTILIIHFIFILGELYVNHKCKTKGKINRKRFVALNFVPIVGPIICIFVLVFVYLEQKEFGNLK